MKINRKKRKGSSLLSFVITIVILGILSGGLYVTTGNMLDFSHLQKDKLYLNTAFYNEINKYNALPLSEINNKNYVIPYNNVNIDFSLNVRSKVDNLVEVEFVGKLKDTTRSKIVTYVK